MQKNCVSRLFTFTKLKNDSQKVFFVIRQNLYYKPKFFKKLKRRDVEDILFNYYFYPLFLTNINLKIKILLHLNSN